MSSAQRMPNYVIIQLGLAPLNKFDDIPLTVHNVQRDFNLAVDEDDVNFFIVRNRHVEARRLCLAWRGVDRWWRDRINGLARLWLTFFPNRFYAAPHLYKTVLKEMRTLWLAKAKARNKELRDAVTSLRGKIDTRNRKRAKLEQEVETFERELYEAELAVNANVAAVKRTDLKSRLQHMPVNIPAVVRRDAAVKRHRIELQVQDDDSWSDE